MPRRTLTLIRNEMRNYLDMAAVFQAMGEYKYAAEYRKEALAMEREIETLRFPQEVMA